MSESTLKRLVGALVVVLALWGIATVVSRGGGSIAPSGDIASFFDGINGPSVTAIRTSGPEGDVELVRSADGWTANGFAADESLIDRMLTSLGDMHIGDLAATNPANHARMGLSPDSAVSFEIDLGDESRTILVGKQGSRFGTSYARLPDSDDVYLVEGDLRVHARRRLDDWRNKVLASVDTARVARVEITRDGESYALVRGDSVWTLADGSEADANQVRNVLTELSSVLASGFLTEGDSLAALPPGGSNTAFAADGGVLSEVTIGSGEGERWARASGDSILYRLSTFRVGRLAPTLDAITPGS